MTAHFHHLLRVQPPGRCSHPICRPVQFTDLAKREKMGHGNSSLMSTAGYQQGTGDGGEAGVRKELEWKTGYWDLPLFGSWYIILLHFPYKKKGLSPLAAFFPSLVCQLCGVVQWAMGHAAIPLCLSFSLILGRFLHYVFSVGSDHCLGRVATWPVGLLLSSLGESWVFSLSTKYLHVGFAGGALFLLGEGQGKNYQL